MAKNRFQPTDVTFSRLTDFFLAEVRKGAAPSVEALAAAFPQLADESRDNFPALLLLEKTV